MIKAIVVDDEILTREGISANVPWEKLGYELAAACADGREAQAYVKEHEVDVVLTDICMPYIDGLQLSEFLYREYPQVKIIIFSGYDEFEYAKQALKYQVTEYLLKPVTAFELSEVLLQVGEKISEQKKKDERIGKMSTTYHRNHLLVRSNALMSLVMGDKTREENDRELEDVGITLWGSAFRVAVVEIDDYRDANSLDDKQKQERSLMAFVVYNVAQEIVEKQHAGEVFQGKDYRTVLLLETNRPAELGQRLHEIAGEISRRLLEIMNMKTTIGIGGCVKERGELFRSYEEAMTALQYRYTYGEESVLILEEISGTPERSEAEAIMERILDCVKRGDRDGIKQCVDKMKEDIRRAAWNRERVNLQLQQQLDETVELLRSFQLEEQDILWEKERTLEKIIGAAGLEQALGVMEEYFLKVSGMLDTGRNDGGKKYALLAMEYIEKHYGENDLGLSTVCSYLNISTSRFSTIFKNITGETFMEVLTGIRMQKARELLENTSLKNYEIAEKVGFSDPHYFSAAFKKAIGKSPTEYAREKRI